MAQVLRFYDVDGVEIDELKQTHEDGDAANNAYDLAVATLNHGGYEDAVKVVFGNKQHAVPTPAGSVERVAAAEARAAADAAKAKRAAAKAKSSVETHTAKGPKSNPG